MRGDFVFSLGYKEKSIKRENEMHHCNEPKTHMLLLLIC